jgi:hypothetical protein
VALMAYLFGAGNSGQIGGGVLTPWTTKFSILAAA